MLSVKSLPLCLLVLFVPVDISALANDAAQLSRGRLFESLASPSGKLTVSPELVIPEPSDPTAILLQNNAITTLSERIRASKGNSAWVSGSINAIKAVCVEQESAIGNFPGPLPVIYSGTEAITPKDLAGAGANGILVPICDGNEIESIDQIASDDHWTSFSKLALECGLSPIPEVVVSDSTGAAWTEADIEKLVKQLSDLAEIEPVSVLLTLNPSDDEQDQVPLPKIPTGLGKKTPILGSVRATAGENRLGRESQRFKDAGFTGVLLRSDCVPGFRMNPDLDVVGRFWGACIGDLKSTRSKSFNFNSRNNMEKNTALEWVNYQKDVIESGALGDPNESHSVVDSTAGEYEGFA